MTVHRARSNTSLDERALTEAAKALNEYGDERDWTKMRPDEMAELAITTYLAALPELGDERSRGDRLAEAVDTYTCWGSSRLTHGVALRKLMMALAAYRENARPSTSEAGDE